MLLDFASNFRVGMLVVWFVTSIFVLIAGMADFKERGRVRLLLASALMMLASPAITLL